MGMTDQPSPDASADASGTPTPGEPLSFECPRCQDAVDEMFYGPCKSCRDALRAAYDSVARDIVADAYEPKMNVTPNAVASKE